MIGDIMEVFEPAPAAATLRDELKLRQMRPNAKGLSRLDGTLPLVKVAAM